MNQSPAVVEVERHFRAYLRFLQASHKFFEYQEAHPIYAKEIVVVFMAALPLLAAFSLLWLIGRTIAFLPDPAKVSLIARLKTSGYQ
jgi:hypothetical protein